MCVLPTASGTTSAAPAPRVFPGDLSAIPTGVTVANMPVGQIMNPQDWMAAAIQSMGPQMPPARGPTINGTAAPVNAPPAGRGGGAPMGPPMPPAAASPLGPPMPPGTPTLPVINAPLPPGPSDPALPPAPVLAPPALPMLGPPMPPTPAPNVPPDGTGPSGQGRVPASQRVGPNPPARVGSTITSPANLTLADLFPIMAGPPVPQPYQPPPAQAGVQYPPPGSGNPRSLAGQAAAAIPSWSERAKAKYAKN